MAVVRAATYAKSNLSAKFTIGGAGGGGEGKKIPKGEGYANQSQILAYAPGASAVDSSLILRPNAQGETYYGLLAPASSNRSTKVKLIFNSKNSATLRCARFLDHYRQQSEYEH